MEEARGGGADGAPPGRTFRRAARIAGGAVVIALVALGLHLNAEGQNKSGGKGKGNDKGEARAVPVVIADVEQRDLPIYLEGLGTVVASQTVTVRPQVDGRLDKVVFREGQDVKAGDVLAEIDPRPFTIELHSAEASVARDRAALDQAKTTFSRNADLAKNGLVTTQQVDDARAAVSDKEGALLFDQASVEKAKLDLDYAHVKSPIDGVTGVRLVDAGNLVHAADPTGIVVVTELDPISVTFTLPQDDLEGVSKALAAGKVEVDAFARDGQKKLGTGDLLLVDNQINVATATIKLKATFENKDRQLWPNQFVKARLLLTVKKDAIVIPAAAVQRGPSGTLVYVVGSDDVANARPIDVERIEGEVALVAKGLDKGERVVTDGQAQIKPGAKVVPHKAGEKPGAGEKPKSNGGSSPDALPSNAPSANPPGHESPTPESSSQP